MVPVLPWKYWSTPLTVLEYFLGSTESTELSSLVRKLLDSDIPFFRLIGYHYIFPYFNTLVNT